MHWTRKTIYTLLTIFILLYFGYLYMENIFLPMQFKRFVTTRMQEFLHRSVTIADLHFSPLRGFIINNIAIYQKDDPQRVFIQIDEASCHILLTPFLKHKLIVIPSIRITKPFIQITRLDQNTWNFSDLLAAPNPTHTKASPPMNWTVLPRKIIIEDGEVAYADTTSDKKFIEVISNIAFDARISLTKVLRFTLLATIPRKEATINVKGNYEIDKQELTSRIILQKIPLAQYVSLFLTSPAIHMPQGTLNFMDINLAMSRNKIQAKGELTLEKTTISLNETTQITGNLKTKDAAFLFKNGQLQAKGHLEFPDFQIAATDGKTFKGAVNADIQTFRVLIAKNEITAQGNLLLQQIDGQWAADSRASVKNLQINNFNLLKNDHGFQIQTSLNAKELEAAFPEQTKFNGDCAAQKTRFVFEKGTGLSVSSDLLINNAHINWGKEQFLRTELLSNELLVTYQDNRLNVQSDIHLSKTLLQLSPRITLEGGPNGTINYQLDPDAQSKHQYSGSITFANEKLHGISYLDIVQDIIGTIHFENNTISTNQITFKTQGSDIALAGSISGFTNPQLNIQAKTKNLDIQRLFSIFPALTALTEKSQIHPAGTAAVEISYASTNAESQYSGTITFLNGKLGGIPYVDLVQDIIGTVHFKNNKITSDQLTFQTQGTDIMLSGSLLNFTSPQLDIQAKTKNLNIEKLFSIFPALAALADKSQIHPAGTTAIEISYKGDIKDPLTAEITADALLKEAIITSNKTPDKITNVIGEIHYTKDLVTWKDIKGIYKDKEFTINGQLANFNRPVLDMEINSTDLKVITQINILRQAFQLVAFSGKYLNNSVDLKGDVHLFEDTGPDIDLRGTFTLNLEELPILIPTLKENFEKIKPLGTFSGEGLFKGKPSQWQDWALTFTARAPTVVLNGFYSDDVTIDYEQRDRNVSKCNLRSRLYNGDLNVTSSADLTQNTPTIRISTTLTGMDLAALRQSKLPQNKFLAGNLSGFLNLTGPLAIPHRWKGDGSIGVKDGHLWQLNILNGILGALLIEEFTNVIFTDGEASLNIKEGKIYTDDAVLNSQTMSLQIKGWIDFDQNIQFNISPILSELTAAESPSFKKTSSLILAQTQDYVNVQLTGSLSNPRYKIQAMPFKILEKTTDMLKEGGGLLKEGIGSILEEVF